MSLGILQSVSAVKVFLWLLILRKGWGVIIIKCIEKIQQIKASIKPIFD
jgi:hypothetical protein